MTFGSVIRILVVGCLVGPALTDDMRPPITNMRASTRTATTTTNCGGFSVRRAEKGQSGTPPVTLRFDDEITNDGGWDQETNVFTAPCNGRYFFTFSAISPETGHNFMLALMKGDKYEVTAYGAKDGYETGTNSALLNLKLGDEVYLQLQDGMVFEYAAGDRAYTSFTGFPV